MIDRRLTECLIFQKPYLGPAFRALQGEPQRHAYMRALVALLSKAQLAASFKILEVGSWAGGSAITWAKALQEFVGSGQVVCVDPWEPYFDTTTNTDPVYVGMNEAATNGLIYGLFQHNIRTSGVSNMILPLVGMSRQVLPTLKNEDFTIVYLDGDHNFQSVRDDIALSMGLVPVDGVLCGDDLELQFSQVGAEALAADVASRKDYVKSLASESYYHPGVTRAVWEAFGEVSVWEGFWAMRKTADGWQKVDLSGCVVEVPEHITGGQFDAAESHSDMRLQIKMIGQVAEQIRRHQLVSDSSADNLPVLIGSYLGFNIVRLNGFYYGVRQSIGEIDWSLSSAELAQRFGEINFVTSDASAVVDGVGLKEVHGYMEKMSSAVAEALLRQESRWAALDRRVRETEYEIQDVKRNALVRVGSYFIGSGAGRDSQS